MYISPGRSVHGKESNYNRFPRTEQWEDTVLRTQSNERSAVQFGSLASCCQNSQLGQELCKQLSADALQFKNQPH